MVEKREVPERGPVLRDEVIYFPGLAEPTEEYFFRRVEIWNADKEESIVFLTNHQSFGPTTIGRIYKDRWQVELFFKALKQNLKIKTFVGTSANAVRTQVWTALIAMLVLRYLQLKAKFAWSLSNLARRCCGSSYLCIGTWGGGWTSRMKLRRRWLARMTLNCCWR